MYLNILGRIGAKCSRALSGESGACSNADIDALELNVGGGNGGEPALCPCEEDEDVESVMVATEPPLDWVAVRVPGDVCGQVGFTSDIRRGSAVGE